MELKEFGEYFAEIRKREGYKSQRDLAEKSGISNATISRLESGITKVSPEVLRELSNCFVTVTYEELMQQAGYLNIESIVDEFKEVYEMKKRLGSRYDEIAYQLRNFHVIVNKDYFWSALKEKGITIEDVSNNLSISVDELIEVLKGKKYLNIHDAIVLSRDSDMPFSDLFWFVPYTNDEGFLDSILLTKKKIDDLIRKEKLEEFQAHLVKNSFLPNSLPRLGNEIITKDEEKYLLAQLKIYRELKLSIN